MTPPPASTSRHGTWFWLSVVAGIGLGYVGVRYGLDAKTGANGRVAIRWLVGLLLTHDLGVLPVVGMFGWLVGRALPRWAAGPVRGAAATSALVVVFAWPLIRRYGAGADNPSRLPDRSYGTNVLWVIAVVWAVALVAAAWQWRTTRRLDGTAPRR